MRQTSLRPLYHWLRRSAAGAIFSTRRPSAPTRVCPWAQIIDGTGYHPTFLYESIWCFLLFIFLMYFSKNNRRFPGQIVCLYGILYSVERFFVEGLRTDSLMIGPLRQAQVLSLALIAGCAVIYVFLRRQALRSDNMQNK